MKALVARPGGFGGVLLAGPAVRAVATRAGRVTMLCDPEGAPAARLLPHVDDVVVWAAHPPHDGTGAPPGGPARTDAADSTDRLVRRLRQESYDVALVLPPTPHSPLPTARLLRTARVRRIGATAGGTGEPYDGCGRADGLLDVLRPRRPGRHEAEAALDTAAAMGFGLRTGDDGRLRVLPAPDTATLTGNGPYVVVHPGAADPARAWDAGHCAEAVARLADAGHRVVVTGGPGETGLTRRVSGATAVDLGGRTTPRTLAGVLRNADAVVTAATGPAHLAAAVGTPVAALSATAEGRCPYRVPAVLLGDRAHPGPLTGSGHPGDGPLPEDVVRAVRDLLATRT
ncbi:glycosyl transferase [Streptomyces cyaneogriseus subsp. noncyanogenus]|uniref:Glycosyl transferase n=1 Tax=Streptomyces cyaneogriseus subsp. noncyanogenus TaxID=477245 RepID=A0A0C5GLT8_9ACTN|nr:glycosyltransferase family 9 protein [Streptomyces cyaneogriseus]AJP05446.1 glycosyl transferase [Streptomyces cyaneogriseus subsp. noncyanogenus]